MKPNLIYTIAVDLPGEHTQRAMAKMMVSSALRCDPNVEVAVFTNSERPLFQIERSQVHEMTVDLKPSEESFWDRCMALKYGARHAFDGRDFAKVLFLDSDCLVLRGLEDVFSLPGRIRYAEEEWRMHHPAFNACLTEEEMEVDRPGINAGTWMVEGDAFFDLMAQWEAVNASPPVRKKEWSEQPAWSRVVLDAGTTAQPFPPGTLRFPSSWHPLHQEWEKATLVHVCGPGMNATTKPAFMFGIFAQRFYGDAAPLMMDLLEP